MAVGLHPYQLTMQVYGERVNRTTASLPQTTASAIFTISGGRVLVTAVIGEVTTAIQNQANNTKLIYNPSSGSDVDLCAVLNIANDAVGEQYVITGTFSDALVSGLAVKSQVTPALLNTGTIDLSCAASNTGSVKWTVFYLPVDDGAIVTAA